MTAEAQQQQRIDRAISEYRDYLFYPVHREGRRWFDCLRRSTGETYETTRANCTCWDWVRRCRPEGLACKHMLMLDIALMRGDVLPPPSLIPRRPA